MNIIPYIIENALEQKKVKKWDRLYWAIDLHDTVLSGTYNKFNVGAKLYPCAKEVLDFLYTHPEHQTILWTSSHDDAISDITSRFDLKFNYVNMNPECPSTELCNFHTKLYFNILLDDKAGFDGNTGWETIKQTLIKNNIWQQI
jgi:hypothetical protein